jgi:hypothetical protein
MAIGPFGLINQAFLLVPLPGLEPGRTV